VRRRELLRGVLRQVRPFWILVGMAVGWAVFSLWLGCATGGGLR